MSGVDGGSAGSRGGSTGGSGGAGPGGAGGATGLAGVTGSGGGAAGTTGAGGGTAGTTGAGGMSGATGAAGGGGGPAFDCLGRSLPTTAPLTFTMTGGVNTNRSGVLPGATVTAVDINGTTLLNNLNPVVATTGDLGIFRLDFMTQGTPLDLHLVITKTGQLDTFWYPPAPFAGPYNTNGLDSFTASELDFLLPSADVTRDNTKSIVIVIVVDCARTRVSGATIATTPAAGAMRYWASGSLSTTATATSTAGEAFFLNMPPGDVMVSAAWNGSVLRSHHVTAVAGAVTEALVGP